MSILFFITVFVQLLSCTDEESSMRPAKEIVIYYSRAGENYFQGDYRNITKGNTQHVAEFISKIRGADLFKVEEKEDAYPERYDEATALARKLKSSKSRPQIISTPNIEQYQRIFIGHPIFYDDMPMHMFTLLEQLDFTGKEVYQFVTHEGSGFGSSTRSLRKLCSKASSFTAGYSVYGYEAADSEESVKRWLSTIPLTINSSSQQETPSKKEL